MNHPIYKLLLSLWLLAATQAYAEQSYAISPSVGNASISNINGYNSSPYLRLDGSLFPIPQLGINLFAASYSGFNSSGGTNVAIKLNGYGAGGTGRGPIQIG